MMVNGKVKWGEINYDFQLGYARKTHEVPTWFQRPLSRKPHDTSLTLHFKKPLDTYRVFFYWSALKMTKFETLREFLHLELF